MMTDLPFGAVKVQVENGYAKFIGANGEVLGSREICHARSRDAESAIQAEFTDNRGNTIGQKTNRKRSLPGFGFCPLPSFSGGMTVNQ